MAKVATPYLGPWEIVSKLTGSSYALHHKFSGAAGAGKRHAAHLSPVPNELIPFEPVDGPDNQYGQLYVPIKKSPYTAPQAFAVLNLSILIESHLRRWVS